eukprot:2461648-Heterocapsa_arctica.AAC.1
MQDEVNKNKRRTNIEAHQNNVKFEIPATEIIRKEEMTDEQTNHSFFNGKETRKKATLKAKQIQTHTRAKTMNNILDKDA